MESVDTEMSYFNRQTQIRHSQRKAPLIGAVGPGGTFVFKSKVNRHDAQRTVTRRVNPQIRVRFIPTRTTQVFVPFRARTIQHMDFSRPEVTNAQLRRNTRKIPQFEEAAVIPPKAPGGGYPPFL